MKKKTLINKLILFIACVQLVSCTGLRKIPPGEKLYTGAKFEIIEHGELKNKNLAKTMAKGAIRPRPNQKFLGIRPKLLIWQLAGNPKKKGFRNWLKNQGEAPVLLSSVKPSETATYIDAALFNVGIFNSHTKYRIIEKKRTAKVIYTSYVHPEFIISQIKYNINNKNIENILETERKKQLIETGDKYNLDALREERERIDVVLKNNGYYFFNGDYLQFRADTSNNNKTVKLELVIKDDVPERALEVFTIGRVVIDTDYSLQEEEDTLHKRSSPLNVDGVIFKNAETRTRPGVILRSVVLMPGDIYSREKHNITLSRLMNMGIYKFVRIQLNENDSGKNILDMHLLLTPMPKRTLRSEINMVSKSNDFVGPHANFNYMNRNTFNGAELLNLNIGGSFETQLSGKYKNLFSYSFRSRAEILFPRFLVPFKIKNTSSYYVPKTKLMTGYDYLKRVGYFDLNSLQFVYGFKWKETALKEHELNPGNINLVSVTNRTPEFISLLESNPFIRRSYEDQFIAGAVYSFLYNEQILSNRKNQFYFNLTAETAGNSLFLADNLAGKKPSGEDPSRLAGVIYSQFMKINIDARNYLAVRSGKLVYRMYAGVGKPYGNSSTLPYIKQFFSGGPNSVRAFPINSLGPGTYSLQLSAASLFLQQGGDIKLEANVEYRFDILRALKGAIFTDAGNTWLFKTNPAVTGDPFSFSEFYKEIAVGAGIGLRLDVSFFVLRFDLATPFRKPWLTEGRRWVIDRFDLSDPAWRSDNLILNVAIGYPF